MTAGGREVAWRVVDGQPKNKSALAGTVGCLLAIRGSSRTSPNMKTTTSLLVLATTATVFAQSAPTVQLQNGTLQGAKCPSNNVNSFLGIPYAQSPVGALRFAPPLPYNQKFASQDATRPPPACIQFSTQFGEAGPQSEDWYDPWRMPSPIFPCMC